MKITKYKGIKVILDQMFRKVEIHKPETAEGRNMQFRGKPLLVCQENYTYRRECDDAKKTKSYWVCTFDK